MFSGTIENVHIFENFENGSQVTLHNQTVPNMFMAKDLILSTKFEEVRKIKDCVDKSHQTTVSGVSQCLYDSNKSTVHI